MGIALAVLTILGPALTPLLVWWVEKRLRRMTPAERVQQELDEIDAHILQHIGKNPSGLIALSHTLERLSREADRKRGHPRQ